MPEAFEPGVPPQNARNNPDEQHWKPLICMYVNNILLVVAINNILASINIILIQIMDKTLVYYVYTSYYYYYECYYAYARK